MSLLRMLLIVLLPGWWALTAVASTDAPDAGGPQLHFDVYLDGKPIGHHSYHFEPADNGFRLVSEASYDVKLLFVTVYRYRHRAEELWRDGCLVALASSTDDNGEVTQVQGRRTGGDFRLTVNDESVAVGDGDCLRSYAYWHPRFDDFARLLNPQTGEIAEASFAPGASPAPPWSDQAGESLALTADDASLQLWYGPEGAWRGLQTDVGGKRTLQYRPVRTLAPQSLPFVEEHL